MKYIRDDSKKKLLHKVFYFYHNKYHGINAYN